MSQRPLHILFNPSARGDLSKALHLCGLEAETAVFVDSLEFGPIASTMPERVAWFDEVLGYDWTDIEPEMEAFWSAALDVSRERYVWLSRHSAPYFCGFLSWLDRNGEAPFHLIDLTDLEVTHANGQRTLCPSPGLIRAEEFVQWRLWETAQLPAPVLLREWRDLWQSLKRENAPLRQLTSFGLVSAELDAYDANLLAQSSRGEWRTVAYVVGSTMAAMWPFGPNQPHQTGDLLLIARVYALIDAGMLEAEGDEEDIHSLKVRRV